jgi:hypothetical protein
VSGGWGQSGERRGVEVRNRTYCMWSITFLSALSSCGQSQEGRAILDRVQILKAYDQLFSLNQSSSFELRCNEPKIARSKELEIGRRHEAIKQAIDLKFGVRTTAGYPTSYGVLPPAIDAEFCKDFDASAKWQNEFDRVATQLESQVGIASPQLEQ